MKKLFLLLVLAISLTNCESATEEITTPESEATAENNTIVGRWHLVGFEQTVMYQFTDNLRHTIYSTDGTFGDITTAIPNPHDWYYENDNLVVDLNFGNFLFVSPSFKCEGNVVELLEEDGSLNSTLFREGFDYSGCTE